MKKVLVAVSAGAIMFCSGANAISFYKEAKLRAEIATFNTFDAPRAWSSPGYSVHAGRETSREYSDGVVTSNIELDWMAIDSYREQGISGSKLEKAFKGLVVPDGVRDYCNMGGRTFRFRDLGLRYSTNFDFHELGVVSKTYGESTCK